ncbi:N-alpha-acetyltransferase 30-like [Colias croceus]|uniref:N-alpha-acetyltransferase 30-like n=1 Tax=Colias crocea TaxID=72248 RepID=UPI001E2800BB|nr:N-alpha-acetyltransferase 30-like [Colias croceus]
MSQLAEENVQNIRSNQKCSNVKNKNKKSKDPPVVPDEESIKVSEEKLSEVLTNALNINHHNNLTNGTSEHSKYDILKSNLEPLAQEAAPCKETCVNSVHCSDLSQKANNENGSSEHEDSRCSVEETMKHKESCHQQEQESRGDIAIISYESELQMPEIMRLIQKDLSEPYSIYTYRYFIHNWPKLCFLAIHEGKCIGAIVCKLDMHRNVVKRGYIAMLAVDKRYRKRGIGSRLVQKAIQVMINDNADEVVLETEITNKPALKLYENLGFVRDKRLFRYYLNGVDALRLKLWLR